MRTRKRKTNLERDLEKEQEQISKEEDKRIANLLETSDFKVLMANGRELNLWKFSLLFSKIPNLSSSDQTSFRLTNPQVVGYIEELIILRMVLEKSVELDPKQIVDYYFFFRSLGMKRQMMMILFSIDPSSSLVRDEMERKKLRQEKRDRVSFIEFRYSPIPSSDRYRYPRKKKENQLPSWIPKLNMPKKSLKHIFDTFKMVCTTHENEVVKGWFSGRVEEDEETTITLTTFDSALALFLFTQLSKMISSCGDPKEVDDLLISDSTFSKIKVFADRTAKSWNYNRLQRTQNHRDLKGLGHLNDISRLFDRLRTTPSCITPTCKLKSTDGKSFIFHPHILRIRSQYFNRMFEFDGIEKECLLNDREIEIMDMDSKVLQSFRNYIVYDVFGFEVGGGGGYVREMNIGVLAKLLILADKHLDDLLFKVVKSRFLMFIQSAKLDSVEKDSMEEVMGLLKDELVLENGRVADIVCRGLSMYFKIPIQSVQKHFRE